MLCTPVTTALIPFWQDARSKILYRVGSTIRIAKEIKITVKLWILESQKKSNVEHTQESLELGLPGGMAVAQIFRWLKIFLTLFLFFTFSTIF